MFGTIYESCGPFPGPLLSGMYFFLARAGLCTATSGALLTGVMALGCPAAGSMPESTLREGRCGAVVRPEDPALDGCTCGAQGCQTHRLVALGRGDWKGARAPLPTGGPEEPLTACKRCTMQCANREGVTDERVGHDIERAS